MEKKGNERKKNQLIIASKRFIKPFKNEANQPGMFTYLFLIYSYKTSNSKLLSSQYPTKYTILVII